jgi:hypothetical protein
LFFEVFDFLCDLRIGSREEFDIFIYLLLKKFIKLRGSETVSILVQNFLKLYLVSGRVNGFGGDYVDVVAT